jgi:hypothetical protein
MKEKHSVLHIQYKVVGLKDKEGNPYNHLGFMDITSMQKHTDFVKGLMPGQIVDAFYDANKDDGTLAQLAKVHACIRQLAIDTGDSFENLKFEVKRLSGLCIKKEVNGENYMVSVNAVKKSLV